MTYLRRALASSNTGSPRFTDFPSNLIGREYETNGLRILRKSVPARALDPCHRPEGSWALGTRMTTAPRKTGFVWQCMLETIFKQMNKFAAFSYAIRGVGIHYGMAKWFKKSSILFSLLYLLVARRSPPLVIILEIKMMIQTRNSASRIVLRGPSYTLIRSRFQQVSKLFFRALHRYNFWNWMILLSSFFTSHCYFISSSPVSSTSCLRAILLWSPGLLEYIRVHTKHQVIIKMCKFNMFITAVCVLFLIKVVFVTKLLRDLSPNFLDLYSK